MAIGNTAADSRNAKNAIANVNKAYADNVASVSSAWKGGASEAYRNFSRIKKNNINAMLSKYDSLGSRLDSLARSEKRAEDEQARKAAMVWYGVR